MSTDSDTHLELTETNTLDERNSANPGDPTNAQGKSETQPWRAFQVPSVEGCGAGLSCPSGRGPELDTPVPS